MVFNYGTSTSPTYSGVISGTGTLTKTGTGTLTFTGNNSYTGTTTVRAGTLQLGDGTTNGTIAGNITDNAALVFNYGTSTSPTYSGVISGTGTLTKTGTGTLTFTGNNSYTGTTTVSAGTLQLGDGTTNGTIAGNITDNAALVFNYGTSTSPTYSGVISGTGTLTKTGTGTLTFTGNNSYTGTTTVSAGTLQLGDGTTNGTIAGNITDNAALVFNYGTSTSPTYSGVISGTGTLTKSGPGTLTLSGTNTYTGSTTINGGTLQLGATNALPATTTVTVANVAGAVLDLNGYNQTVAGLSGGGTTGGSITVGGGILTVGGTSTTSAFSGVIVGNGSLAKQGTGTLTLSGVNLYNGVTKIKGGMLTIGVANALPTTTAVEVSNVNNAVFNVNGFAQTIASLNGGGDNGSHVYLSSTNDFRDAHGYHWKLWRHYQ